MFLHQRIGGMFLQEVNNNLSLDTLKRGFMSGLNITLELSKILVPIYFIVTFLEYTPIIGWISTLFSPIMGIFGLPGEAAIAGSECCEPYAVRCHGSYLFP